MLAERNTGICLFMAWAGINCLYQFINSVIWNGNIVNWSPVWCDIGTVDLNLIFYCGSHYLMDLDSYEIIHWCQCRSSGVLSMYFQASL